MTLFIQEKIKTLQVLAVLISISALIASIAGIVFPDIYITVIAEKEMPFVFAQDIISFTAAVLLLFLTFFWKRENIKLDIIRVALVGYLFYVYGQYVMGTVYNYFYFLYLSVFGLSVFYLICAFTRNAIKMLEYNMPKYLRIILAVYCAVIPVYFAPQWIIDISNNIHSNLRPGASGLTFNYYVYILDLCFILPISVVASVFLFQKKNMGFLLGGIISVFGFILMLWVALGFLIQPLFNQNMDVSGTIIFSVISILFLGLSIFYFIYTKIVKTDA